MRAGFPNRFRAAVALSIAACLLVAGAGCQTSGPGYYLQAVRGQIGIWNEQRPISELIESPSATDALRDRLRLVLQLREFARTNLHLPPGKHYLHYADLARPSVVWNVSAAPRHSLEAKSWWYPVAGSASYRGYFSRDVAERYAARLRARGLDTHVGGVAAYSTLGWFRDPLLNTFLFDSESALAELLFHELAHQRVFIPGDTEFNEAFATAVAEEGTRRWLKLHRDAGDMAAYERRIEAERTFVGMVSTARHNLELLYTNLPARLDPHTAADVEKRKAEILANLRSDFERATAGNAELAAYSGWFRQPLNNAVLNTVHTYHHLVPGFRRKLESVGMNLEHFHEGVKSTRKMTKAERRHWLESLPITR